MNRIFVLVLVLSFSSSYAQTMQDCSALGMSCGFYDCAEKALPCGNGGYFLGFGERYCRRFDKIYQKLTKNGQSWFFAARACLTGKVMRADHSLSCGELEERLFKEHNPCYMDSGYCGLSGKDKALVIKVVFPLLLKKHVWQTGWKIQQACRDEKRVRRQTQRLAKELVSPVKSHRFP